MSVLHAALAADRLQAQKGRWDFQCTAVARRAWSCLRTRHARGWLVRLPVRGGLFCLLCTYVFACVLAAHPCFLRPQKISGCSEEEEEEITSRHLAVRHTPKHKLFFTPSFAIKNPQVCCRLAEMLKRQPRVSDASVYFCVFQCGLRCRLPVDGVQQGLKGENVKM